jgi:hypothetical protein
LGYVALLVEQLSERAEHIRSPVDLVLEKREAGLHLDHGLAGAAGQSCQDIGAVQPHAADDHRRTLQRMHHL